MKRMSIAEKTLAKQIKDADDKVAKTNEEIGALMQRRAAINELRDEMIREQTRLRDLRLAASERQK